MARFFVNRPIVAIVISIITVLLGVVAMSGLPISQYPEIVPPMIQVTTTFIGASATLKPCARLARISIAPLRTPRDPAGAAR